MLHEITVVLRIHFQTSWNQSFQNVICVALSVYFCFIRFPEKIISNTNFMTIHQKHINLRDCLFSCWYTRVAKTSVLFTFVQSLLYFCLLGTCSVKSFSSANISFLTFQMRNQIRNCCDLSNHRWIAPSIACRVINLFTDLHPFSLSCLCTECFK